MRRVLKVFLEVSILDFRRPARLKRIPDPQNDVPPSFAGVEQAAAICETAAWIADVAQLAVMQIQCQDLGDRLRDLLSVGTHVLDRRSADCARNPAQALDPGAVRFYGAFHQLVPFLACTYLEDSPAVFAALIDTGDRDPQHQPWKSRISNDQVAATAAHERPQLARVRPVCQGPNFSRARCLGEVPRRSTHLERR